MAYEKQTFTDGQVLTAEHLKHMENGIAEAVGTVEPVDGDIPKVYFTGTLPTSKTDGDLKGQIRYRSKTDDFALYATLKVQGSSSVNYPKKNFTLKLYEDSAYENKVKKNFRSWGNLNKFVLKAHWIDHSHVRNVGTAKLWGQVVRSRADFNSLPEELRTAPNNGATDGFTVKFFANGIYQGLYEWIVPKDKLFGQDSDIATHSILNSELNNQESCAFATTEPVISGNWSEELQDSMSSDISTSFENVIKFVAGATDEEFLANAETYLDVQSVIDYDIFARIFCIVDNLCRNQIFFTYDGTKWYEGVWDVDAILGLPPTVRGFFAYNTAFQTGYIAYKDYGMTNLLYQRVETVFNERFKERYAELRQGVLSVENIIDVYERLTDTITNYDGLLAEDYAATTGGGAFTDIPYTAENTIQQIREFVSKRLSYMDAVIENGEDTEEDDTSSDSNNLLDSVEFSGGYINYLTGDVVNNENTFHLASEIYIPVSPGTKYVADATLDGVEAIRVGIKFYNAENVYTGLYIDDANCFAPFEFTVPTGNDIASIRLGFIEDSGSVNITAATFTLYEVERDPDNLLDGVVFFKGYINAITGEFATGDTVQNVSCRDYIPVEPGETYSINASGVSGLPEDVQIRAGIKFYDATGAYTGEYIDDAGNYVPCEFTVPTDINASATRITFTCYAADTDYSPVWTDAVFTLSKVE